MVVLVEVVVVVLVEVIVGVLVVVSVVPLGSDCQDISTWFRTDGSAFVYTNATT